MVTEYNLPGIEAGTAVGGIDWANYIVKRAQGIQAQQRYVSSQRERAPFLALSQAYAQRQSSAFDKLQQWVFKRKPTAETEGYKFRLEQGLKGIERSAAARGGLLSGRTLKEMNRYATGEAYQQERSDFTEQITEAKLNLDNLMGQSFNANPVQVPTWAPGSVGGFSSGDAPSYDAIAAMGGGGNSGGVPAPAAAQGGGGAQSVPVWNPADPTIGQIGGHPTYAAANAAGWDVSNRPRDNMTGGR